MAIKGYIASSMDGYIASLDGKVEFLSNYQHHDCGYDAFIADISTIVMGRKTYEAILSFGVAWPYPKQHTWVLTSHDNLPVEDASVQLWTKGIDVLIEKLKLPEAGNTWVVGGAQLQASFIDKRALDTLEVFLMPEILGMCDRIYVMSQGYVTGCLNRNEFEQERIMQLATGHVK